MITSHFSRLSPGILGGMINVFLFGLSIKTYRSDERRASETGTFFRRDRPSKRTLSTKGIVSSMENAGISVAIDFQLHEMGKAEEVAEKGF